MLVNFKDVLADAKKNNYGVGLFNTVNLEMAKGVLAAAEEFGAGAGLTAETAAEPVLEEAGAEPVD